jgi:hypothetical protein
MGYYSGVAPHRRLVAAVVDQPHKMVRRGVTVVGTLAGLSVALFKAARILARRP